VISVDLMSLWNPVCSVHLCFSVRERKHLRVVGKFFSHRAHRVHWAFGAQFEPTERLRHTEITEAFQLTLAVTFCDIGWLNVSVKLCAFCSSVFSVRKNMSFLICHYVILSYKNHQFLSVTLLFCLQKNHLSPFVIMSLCLQKISVSLSVPLLFCLKTPQLGTEAGPAVVVVISFLSVLYQYFISSATSSPTTFLQYILFDKVVEVTCCGILWTVSYLVPLRGS